MEAKLLELKILGNDEMVIPTTPLPATPTAPAARRASKIRIH